MGSNKLSKCGFLLSLICVCLVIVLVWLYFLSLENAIGRLERRTETKGFPVRVGTLEIARNWPPYYAREQSKLKELFDIEMNWGDGSPVWRWADYDIPQEPYDFEVIKALDEFVTKNKHSFQKMIHRIKDARVGRVTYGDIKPKIAYEQGWVGWARALSKAAVLNAEYGNAEEAKKYLVSSIKLGRLVSYYPSLLPQINRVRMLGVLNGAIVRCVSRLTFDENQLHDIQKGIKKCIEDPLLEVALAGEISFCNEIYYCDKRMEEVMDETGVWLYPVPGMVQKDQRNFLKTTLKILGWQKLPQQERLTKTHKMRNTITKDIKWKWPVASKLIKGVCDSYFTSARRDAWIGSVVTAIAVKRFYLHNDRYPDTLEELGDLCPEEFLIDPYTGNLLKYRVKDATYQVYSLGTDALDEDFDEPDEPDPHFLVEIAK